MTPSGTSDRERAEAAAEVTRRAIRRLDILEWFIYAGAAGIAIAGGAGVSWLLVQMNDWSFRITWIVTSLILFVVPGVIVMMNARREERAARRKKELRDRADG